MQPMRTALVSAVSRHAAAPTYARVAKPLSSRPISSRLSVMPLSSPRECLGVDDREVAADQHEQVASRCWRRRAAIKSQGVNRRSTASRVGSGILGALQAFNPRRVVAEAGNGTRCTALASDLRDSSTSCELTTSRLGQVSPQRREAGCGRIPLQARTRSWSARPTPAARSTPILRWTPSAPALRDRS